MSRPTLSLMGALLVGRSPNDRGWDVSFSVFSMWTMIFRFLVVGSGGKQMHNVTVHRPCSKGAMCLDLL